MMFLSSSIKSIDDGAIEEMNVFVGILPASQYVFVRAVRTQSREDLIAHCSQDRFTEDKT